MEIDEIFNNLLSQPLGSKYYKSDLHIHLDPEIKEDDKLKEFCLKFFDILNKHEIEIIALTVHREESLELLFKAINLLKELAKDANYNLEIYPSIELKDVRNTHFAMIFNNRKRKEDIIRFLGGIGKKPPSQNNINLDKCDQITQDITSPSSNIRKKIIEYDAICFFPHPFTENTGIMKTIAGESLVDFVKDPLTYLWNLGIPISPEVDEDEKSSKCPYNFTSTGSRFATDKIFKKLARIKVSDSHNLDKLSELYDTCPNCKLYNYCNKGFTYLKLSSPSVKGLKQIQYDHKTRVRYNLDNLYNYPYIIGVYIKSEFFEDNYIRFNPELNALIGGRGTGKSLVIDLIRFANNSLPASNTAYYEIFHDKIRDQLGNFGNVIIFYQNNNDTVYAIKRSLMLLEGSKKINWSEDAEISFYIKNQDLTFRESDLNQDTKDFIEALSQTEIPSLHRRTESLLSIIDAFKINFEEKINREKKIIEISKLEVNLKELYEKHENLKIKEVQVKSNLLKQKERYKFLESVKEIDFKLYQTLLETNKRIGDIPKSFNDWFNRIESMISDIPTLDVFKADSIELLSKINNLLNKYNKIQSNLNKQSSSFTKNLNLAKKTFKKDYNVFLKDWNHYFKTEYDKYKKKIKEKDIDFIEKVQENIISLKLDIEKLERELLTFEKNKDDVLNKEKQIVKTAEEVSKLTLLIHSERIKIIKEIREQLKGLKIDIKIRFKNVKKNKEYKDFLLKVHKTKVEDVISNIQNDYSPFLLGKAIIENKISIYSEKFLKRKRMIFEKLNQLVENFDYPLIFTEDLILINLFKIYIDMKPMISFKRENYSRYIPLNRLSIGERCAILLYIMLLEKKKPFLIDQADAELDQDSIRRFSKYLLKIKKTRQIIVATHNANIPVLGDVDLLIHLDTKPSDLADRELGYISSKAGFEDSINELLLLEGGKDAIIRRFKKYDWRIPELNK